MSQNHRLGVAVLASGLVLLAACGSQSVTTQDTAATTTATTTTAAPTTTALSTTTSSTTTSSTTTTSTTTTIPRTAAETSLLANALPAVPSYEYYDYSPGYVDFLIDDINSVPEARDTFASMSLHLLVQKQHVLGIVQLYALRDTTGEPNMAALTEMILDLHGWPLLGSRSTATLVGDVTALTQSSNDFSVTMWAAEGVLYTVWDTSFPGNEAFISDFVAASLSVAQGLPVPEPTVTKAPSTKYIGPEDDDLIARMPVFEDFFYLDVPYETAVSFYKSFNGRTDLERGSVHYLIHGGDIADDDEATIMGYLMLVELKEALKGNTKKIASLVKTLTQGVASEEDTFATTEMKLGGTTVWLVDHYDETGSSTAFVWDFRGVVYLFDTNGECYDTCSEDLGRFINRLILGAIED